MSLVSSLIPINLGWLELRSLLVGSYGHLTHNYLNYPYLFESYKYKLISMVERGRTEWQCYTVELTI